MLTQEEIDVLMQVETTVEQAQQIIDRNQPLLDALRAGEEYYAGLGCPHCGRGYPCYGCAWTRATKDNEFACCHVTFAGLTLHDVAGVICYGWNSEEVHVSGTEKGKENAIEFLKGHIEWAMLVIAQGGIEAVAADVAADADRES